MFVVSGLGSCGQLVVHQSGEHLLVVRVHGLGFPLNTSRAR